MKVDAIIGEKEREGERYRNDGGRIDREIERGDALSMEMHIHGKLRRKVN